MKTTKKEIEGGIEISVVAEYKNAKDEEVSTSSTIVYRTEAECEALLKKGLQRIIDGVADTKASQAKRKKELLAKKEKI